MPGCAFSWGGWTLKCLRLTQFRRVAFVCLFALLVSLANRSPAHAGFVVQWNIDSAQSFVQLALPQQEILIDGSEITIRMRNQSGGTAWNQGNKANVGGSIATEVDLLGSTIDFLGGQSNIYGINSGSYKPNGGSPPNNDSASPAVFGAKVQADIVLLGFSDVANIAIRNILFNIDSGAIPISPVYPNTGPQTFNANQISFGVQSATMFYAGYSYGSGLGAGAAPFAPTLNLNTSTSGSISVPDPLNPTLKKLTFTLNIPIVVDLGGLPLVGTGTGTIVAYAQVPEASSFLMIGLALAVFAVPAVKRRGWRPSR